MPRYTSLIAIKGPTDRLPLHVARGSVYAIAALSTVTLMLSPACEAPSTDASSAFVSANSASALTRTAADIAGVTIAPPGSVAYDRDVFQTLLGNHTRIRREVRVIPDGVETVTESDDADIAVLIRDHVAAMKSRVHDGRRIRQWDPMFVAIFDNAAAIKIDIVRTRGGVRVRETSRDPRVARLIQAHARVVDGFVARGGAESRLAHEVPPLE
jgi:hypothetical protein